MDYREIFTTDRLIIRGYELRDSPRLFDTYRRWEVARYLGATPSPMTDPEQAPATIERWNAQASADGRFGIWAVEDKKSAMVLGTVLLKPLPPTEGEGNGEVEVGWHFHPDSWGHGYATEAARGAVGKGFAEGLQEVYAVVFAPNAASRAVCDRLGMTHLGATSKWYGVELEAFHLARPGRHRRPPSG